MMRRVAVAVLTAALGTGGCSSSGGGTSTPRTKPTASAASASATQAIAARGVMQLALRSVATALYYAQFLQPGRGGPVLGAVAAAPTPTCSAQSATAFDALPNQTGSQITVTTAFYPAGDSVCGQSPLRILVMTYPVGTTPQTGIGYLVTYAVAGDPLGLAPGTPSEFQQIQTTIYASGDGTAQIVSRIESLNAQPFLGPSPPSAPAPGTFPATFPAQLPALGAASFASSSGFSPNGYYATSESGTQSTAGTATAFGGFDAPFQQSQTGNIGTLDTLSLASAAGPSGTATLSASSRNSLYEIDYGNSQEITVPVYPLPEGQTAWALSAVSSIGLTTGPGNFTQPGTLQAAITPDGQLSSCSAAYTDTFNRVMAQVTCSPSGTISLTATDLISQKTVTSPSPVVLDAAGSSAPYTMTFDGSQDAINAFVLNSADQ